MRVSKSVRIEEDLVERLKQEVTGKSGETFSDILNFYLRAGLAAMEIINED
tara:strand:+ start:1857 stop:2009 length:153 start_codon:yes stop_codon:yes gene_type:complete